MLDHRCFGQFYGNGVSNNAKGMDDVTAVIVPEAGYFLNTWNNVYNLIATLVTLLMYQV